MDVEDDHESGGLESREPSVEDLVDLCRALNAEEARYLIVRGCAFPFLPPVSCGE